MRHVPIVLCLAVACFLPSSLRAQEKKFLLPKIEKVRVGFRAYQEADPTSYKVGLWTPIHIEVFGGTDGLEPKPNRTPPYLEIETVDSEDIPTVIRLPIAVEPLQARTFTGYVKTGHMGRNSEIRVRLVVEGHIFNPRPFDQYASLNIDAHLYLTLGGRIDDLHRAARKIGMPAEKKDELRLEDSQRLVVFESEVARMPDRWFGYSGVDLIVLSTENEKFLNALANSDGQLEALATWVRRGGRLVVPVQWKRQDAVHNLLKKATAWNPPIPVIPPKDAGNPLEIGVKRLNKVEDWVGVRGEPFQHPDPKNPGQFLSIPVASLDPGKVPPGNWEVWADTADGRPLVARVRYGLGQIVYLAFSLEDADFTGWSGREQFLQALVSNLSSRAPADVNENDVNRFRGRDVPQDVTTNLIGLLDNFDITVVKFGYVALFIVLYILVVGPLDFVLLKYVFKRLEWTWVTFPSVVIGVSVVAYFTAYALKGRDLKINKVDIVDFDMRTDVDAKGQPRSVHAFGQSFFTILSPRIQNYTVGLEPNPLFWGAALKQIPGKDGKNADEVLSVDSLTWIGRPTGGPHDMRRPGSSGFFRKPYTFRADGSGLEGVPIPVWTTKAFAASWEQKLPQAPFKADLVYHQEKIIKGKEVKITGQLENHLGVDLTDVWLIYGNYCYAIPDGLKSVKPGAAVEPLAIPASPKSLIREWASQNPLADEAQTRRAWSSNPSALVKQLLFHEKFDTRFEVRNHLLRPLDLGWRVEEEKIHARDRRTREAILYARVAYVTGNAEAVTASKDLPLPTKLWLGDLPEDGKDRPPLVGILNQDTFIRVILPVRAGED